MMELPDVVVTRPGAADVEPRRFGALRRYGPWVLAAVRVLVVAWPVLVPVMVGAVVAGPVGVIIVGLVAWVVAARVGWYRRLVAGIRPRVLAVVFRVQWPSVCSLCGFVMAGHRRARYPTLRSVEVGPGWRRPAWWRLEVVPLAQHDEPTWHRYGSRLQRQLGAMAHDQVITDGSGSVVITLARRPLPRLLATTRELLGGADQSGRDRVVLGVDVMGDPIVWTPDDDGRGMLFIGGTQGGGKSNLIRQILAHGLAATIDPARDSWQAVVIDPAGVDFGWCREWATVATTPTEMFAAIISLRAEIDRRAQVVAAHGVNHWLKLPAETGQANDMADRIVLVVDELVALMAMKGRVLLNPPEGKGRPLDQYPVMAAALADTAAMGRKVGVSVVAATQHPIAEHLGPFGSTLKANLGARIGTGALEPEGAGALFGKTDSQDVAAFLGSRIPGRFVARSLSATGPQDRRPGHAYLIGDDLLDDLAAEANDIVKQGAVVPLHSSAA